MRTVLLTLSLSLTLLACGSRPVCTPESCASGCCSESGECMGGTENAACGANGNACLNCAGAGQVCSMAACVPFGGSADSGTPADAGNGTGMDAGMSFTCTRTDVECSDQAIQNLDLKSVPATGGISNVAEGSGWLSTVDSRGGGFQPTESYVYARFTATGMEKLPMHDLTALDNMDWDIAFRRFIVRVNSGDSGPSCVGVATLPVGTAYDSITALPSGLIYEGDDFLDRAPTCGFVPDGSGLDTSPYTALSTFYAYQSCVKTTNRSYVLQTQFGRHVKLTITTYYAKVSDQEACNAGTPVAGATSGTIRVRWAFLD